MKRSGHSRLWWPPNRARWRQRPLSLSGPGRLSGAPLGVALALDSLLTAQAHAAGYDPATVEECAKAARKAGSALFDAYLRPDGGINYFGDEVGKFAFGKCLAQHGQALTTTSTMTGDTMLVAMVLSSACLVVMGLIVWWLRHCWKRRGTALRIISGVVAAFLFPPMLVFVAWTTIRVLEQI